MQADLPGVMLVLITAGTIGFVGLKILGVTIDTAGVAGNQALSNASDNLQTSVSDAYGLIGVAFIVVILAVIVVYLYGLRGGGR